MNTRSCRIIRIRKSLKRTNRAQTYPNCRCRPTSILLKVKSYEKHSKWYVIHFWFYSMAHIKIPHSLGMRSKVDQRKIRLRLHGTRLPPNYTISLRLSTEEDNLARSRSAPRKRRRRIVPSVVSTPSTSPSPPPEGHSSGEVSVATAQESLSNNHNSDGDSASASDEEELDEKTRRTNAYPGATNSIGSVHQRRWFITLDRANSGFEPRKKPRDGKKTWVRKRNDDDHDKEGRLLGFDPFYVRGPDVERSVVTGRTGYEVLQDEGVEGFIPRRGWRPVLD